LLHTTVALRLLRKLAAGHDQRISEARKSMRELAETFDPHRVVRELEICLEVETNMRNKSLGVVRSTFIADVGAGQESVFEMIVPRTGRNQWLTNGNAPTIIYFLDTAESALPSPNNSASYFIHNIKQGTALRSHEHITKLQIKGTPKITTLGAEAQEVPEAAEISELELKRRVEDHLFAKKTAIHSCSGQERQKSDFS
jgi:hypothetical protein